MSLFFIIIINHFDRFFIAAIKVEENKPFHLICTDTIFKMVCAKTS